MTDQYAGTPTSMAGAYVLLEHLQKDNEALVEKVQEVQAEVANFAYQNSVLGEALAVVTKESHHLRADRDDAERECLELREQLDAARCRLQELEPRQRADDV